MNDDDQKQQNNQFPPKQNDDDQTYSAQAAQDDDLNKGQSPFLGANDPVVKEDVSAGQRGVDADELSNNEQLNSQVEDREEFTDVSNLQEIGADVTNIAGEPSNSANADDMDDDGTGRIDENQKV